MIHAAAQRKALGAYYTDTAVAALIANWAVRYRDRVLDPSCGDGAFLHAASLCVAPADSITGIEISAVQADETRARMGDDPRVRVVTGDFFDIADGTFDAVIGNPPFIRYQSFVGASREKALFRCARAGVKLSRLTSSWAPFVVCSSELLSYGGRLGLVLPSELLHAGYAKPVLKYLNAVFEEVTILTFRERLFPELAQDALVVLASGKGSRCKKLLHVEAACVADVRASAFESMGTSVDPQAYLGGSKRITEALIDPRSIKILDRLLDCGVAYRLGSRMRADIGYVTGANEFFHLSEAEARRRRIHHRFLSPTVYRGGSLAGLTYSVADWRRGNEAGTSGYLLRIPSDSKLSGPVQKYIDEGAVNEVPSRYKCRVRSPWYSVPHVYWPQAFLTSMSGERPAVVVNEANVLAGNSLHILRSLCEKCDPRSVALGWLSSPTALSIEIEGHALGGGMLKLEPTEAERVIIVDLNGAFTRAEFRHIDALLRGGGSDRAVRFVDDRVSEITGVTHRDLRRLGDEAMALRQRRMKPRR